MIDMIERTPAEVDRVRSRALVVGAVALALAAVGAIFDPTQFFRSYLLGYIFVVGIALGSFAILMVQHMSGGAWGVVIRRPLEAATRTFPVLALLFLPIVVGLLVSHLYPWAHPETDIPSQEVREIVHRKALYLNPTFFIVRAAFYFAVWIGWSTLLNRYSLEQDRTGVRYLTRKMQVLSGPGLLIYGFTVTFSAIDWVMSLAPDWYSTIFGILFMGGQGLSAMAFMITVLVLLSNYKPLSEAVQPRHLHDLGKLMLAFLMLWAYFAFSQFLIIWSANIPEEAQWYTRRLQTPWKYVGLALVVLHFALPFVLLLSRDLKRNGRTLVTVAVAILVMRYVDLFWMTGPEFHGGLFVASWMDFVMPFGIGGLWLAFYLYQLKSRPLLPIQDPYLEEALAHTAGH